MEMYRTKPKNQGYLKVVQEQYSDQEFLEHFRVNRTIANEIAVKFEQSQYYSYQSGEFGKLTAYEYLQVVCDHKRKIRNVVTGFPGSLHDSRVFRASPLSTMLEQKCQQNYILGDSGYPCLRHLLTPFKDMGNLTNVQQNYNWRLAKTRYIVEHTFGILKQKFRQLYLLKLRGDREPENSPTTVHRRKIPRQQFIDKKIYRQENSTTGKFLDKQFIE
nr:unnamed protein product [Callosobruchus analis]